VCDKIKQLMEEVTVSGTGTRANLSEYGGAGGKTGSAETGQFINGEKVVHAWFAGYFPGSTQNIPSQYLLKTEKAAEQ